MKICGLNSKEGVDAAVRAGVGYIGCVFDQTSMNWVTPSFAEEITLDLPTSIKKVAVVSRPSGRILDQILFYFKPDFVQFSERESPEYLAIMKATFECKIIKKLVISNKDDLKTISSFRDVVDMFLFEPAIEYLDEYSEKDKFFDWGMFKKFVMDVPWMIAGNISRHNVGYIVQASGAEMIDVSHSLERGLGKKDPRLIAEFMNMIREKFI